MKHTTLEPIVHRDEHSALVERELLAFFSDVLFTPIQDVLTAANVRMNDKPEKEHSALWDALMFGVIWYAAGMFTGSFNAAISRELRAIGARRRGAGFALAQEDIPLPLRAAIAASAAKALLAHEEILSILAGIEAHVEAAPTGIAFTKTVDNIVDDLQEQFVQSISVEGESTPVQPGMREGLRDTLETETDRAIKGFTLETTQKLRARVKENLASGARTDRLAKVIEAEFGVAQRRARYLAERETSLLISKFRETRYREIGASQYVWCTSHDERVRPDHALLDRQVFSWDNPPVANRATGDRYHPGMGPNCFPGDSEVKLMGGVKKVFRHWYCGELAEVITDTGKTLRATPNHPVLTKRGWKAIGLLNESDEVVELCEGHFGASELDHEEGKTTFRELFEAALKSGSSTRSAGNLNQFHGDGTDGDVDIVDATGSLFIHRKSSFFERLREVLFAGAAFPQAVLGYLFDHLGSLFRGYAFCAPMGCHSKGLSFVRGETRHTDKVSFRTRTGGNAGFKQIPTDDRPSHPKSFGDRQLTISRLIRGGNESSVDINSGCGLRLSKIIRKTRRVFHGFVYNLESEFGYYATTNVVVSNCRCWPRPVLTSL